MFERSIIPRVIEEVDISIDLKDGIIEDNGFNPFMLRVIAKCNNAEFNDLDEYIFSRSWSSPLVYLRSLYEWVSP